MKKLSILLLFITVLSFGLNSCQKPIVFVEGSGPGSSLPAAGTINMSAKVNGTLVNCNIINAMLESGTDNLSITGEKGVEAFQFLFQNFNGAGDYNAGDFMSSATYSNGTDPLTQVFFAESGHIKITSFTETTVKGTFNFIAINSVGDVKNITDGKFLAQVVKN